MDLNRHTECENQILFRRELHFISWSGERHGSTGTCADGSPNRRTATAADYRSDHGTSDYRASDPPRVCRPVPPASIVSAWLSTATGPVSA